MSILEVILNKIKKQNQQKYGVAVFDIDFKETKKGVEVRGDVLLEGHKKSILNALEKNKIKVSKEQIKVLSNDIKRYEIGWAVVKNNVLDLKSRYVYEKILNDKILKRIKCSQAFQEEILRILYKNKEQLLVQQSDLTLGWVNRKDVIIKKENLYKRWKKGNYAVRNKTIKITKKRGVMKSEIGNKIIKEVKKYLGANYVLGGKTKKGIDCSGLIQVVYKNSFDIILPRHSWDQKEVGKKINLENVKTGDLIFLVKKKNGHKHVGVVEVIKPQQDVKRFHDSIGTMESAVVNLIHASLDKKKVVRQDLNEVFENYDFMEARRITE